MGTVDADEPQSYGEDPTPLASEETEEHQSPWVVLLPEPFPVNE
jgi:hypothetical protein